MASQVQSFLLAQEGLPAAVGDTGTPAQRGSKYGDTFTLPLGSARQNMALEGTYWTALAAAPGSTVAYGSGGTQASFSDITGFVVVKNNNQAGSKLRTSLDYMKIMVSGTVPAAATSVQYAIKCDTGPRTPTGAVSAATAVVGASSAPAPFATQVWFPNAGVPTIPAVQSARVIGTGTLRQVIPVTLDEYVLKFGSDDVGIGLQSGSTVGRFGGNAPPVVLAPQEFAIIHLWLPSATTNPLTCQIELAGWER